MAKVTAAALAAAIACAASAAAAAVEPAVPDEPLEIVLVGSPPVRAMLREAVAPLLPDRERVVWINREDGAAGFADALVPSRRLRIRIDVPDGGAARVTFYPPAGSPIVRAIDGAQPGPVTVESVAQIVGETTRALVAEAVPPAAAPSPQPAVVLSTVPVVAAAPSRVSFSMGAAYQMRSIFDCCALPGGVAAPWESGPMGWISVFFDVGAFRLSATIDGEYTHASAGTSPTSIQVHRYTACVLLGVGWSPHELLHLDLAVGGGAEQVNHSSLDEQYFMLRGRLSASVRLWRGVEAVGAIITDVRTAQTFSAYVNTPSWQDFKNNRVQPGFTLGLAWSW